MPTNDYENYMKTIGYHTKDSHIIDEIYLPIENYIYLYHTHTGIILPNYPDNISDSMSPQYLPTLPLGRSAPIYSYSGTNARTVSFLFLLHREMLEQVNLNNSVELEVGEDYVDRLVKEILAAALPNYAASDKMIDPPLAACKIGNEVYIKGVISGAVTVSYSGPILSGKYDNKYAVCTVGFAISEVDPYDAQTVMSIGSYRASNESADIVINMTLDLTPVRKASTKSGYALPNR